MLEHVGIAGEQRRYCTAQHLPDREVPRHHRQQRAQRTVFDARLASRYLGRLGLEHGRAIGRIPFAQLGAFLDFALGLGDRLAHFIGDHPRHGHGVVAQGAGQGQQQVGTRRYRRAAPGGKAGGGPGQGGIQDGSAFIGVMADLLAAGGVDRQSMGLEVDRGHHGGPDGRRTASDYCVVSLPETE
ncbi:hypothetical protein D9M71_539140 [compost metagenome]